MEISRRQLLRGMGRIALASPAVALLSACGLGTAASPFPAIPRIGYLSPGFPSPVLDTLRQALRELGYLEGQDIAFDFRFAAGQDARLRELAGELINQQRVDILVALGGAAAAAAKDISRTTPIIFVRVGDPVGTGLVNSLARPGGNLTGLTSFSPQLIGKRLELLKSAVPGARRVLALWDTGHPQDLERSILNTAAFLLGVNVVSVEVPGTTEFDDAVNNAGHADALLNFMEDVTFNQRRRILSFASKAKLPAMYPVREFVDDGGLLSYGPSVGEQFKRAAVYIDKMFKGAKPWELPIEQPTRFEMVISAKAAQSIGLTIAEPVLIQADEVIR